MSSFSPLLDSVSSPIGDLIAAIGAGVAEAQRALDDAALETARAIATQPDHEELRALGYAPTWYQIPEAEAEIAMALTLTGADGSGGAPRRPRLVGTPVDAAYSNRYNFNLKMSSKVRFKIVPVPAPLEAERQRFVPSLVGLSLAEARTAAAAQGLELAAESAAMAESARVRRQAPAAGEMLPVGGRVAVS